MQTMEAITKRASVREYQAKAIEKNLLKHLVDAARRAPSARHVQPWEFVLIQNKDTLNKISRLAPNGAFIKQAACCLAVFCRDTKYYLEDGCAATENILLAASDLGLGACWVAGDKKDYAQGLARMLNAPEEARLISLISLGWPREKVEQSARRSLNEVVHWESF